MIILIEIRYLMAWTGRFYRAFSLTAVEEIPHHIMDHIFYGNIGC